MGDTYVNTGDNAIFNKCIKRALASGVNTANFDEVIIFLGKEIDNYRGKIARMEAYIDGANARIKALDERNEKQNAELTVLKGFRDCVNSHYGFTQLEAVQDNTAGEIIKALSDNGYNVSINLFKNDESEV